MVEASLARDLKEPKKLVVLVTGGTGGHVMPAMALAEALLKEGHHPFFIIDDRAQPYITETFGYESPLVLKWKRSSVVSFIFWNQFIHSFLKAKAYLKENRPLAVIAFGGYTSLPAAMAAVALRLPLYLHEQNAVLGKTHRLLLPFAKKLFLSFEETAGIPLFFKGKCVVTGMPVRERFHAEREHPSFKEKDTFSLLILGGSQGAGFFSELLPKALAILPERMQKKIKVTQQCRPEKLMATQQAYKGFGGSINLAPFYNNIEGLIKEADLIISRAGSSTLAELAVLGKKALFIPFKKAVYDHQTANAQAQCAKGGGWFMAENEVTPALIADFIKMQYDNSRLKKQEFSLPQQRAEKVMIDFLVELFSSSPTVKKNKAE